MRIIFCALFIVGCTADGLPDGDGGQKDMRSVDAKKSTDRSPNLYDFSTPSYVYDSATTPHKHVLATTTLYDGHLGGLAGADALCASAAAAQGFGSSSTWTAWLSTTTVNAIDRISGSGPWVRLDETIVFADRAALQSVPSAPVTPGAIVFSWTGTALGGHGTAFNCANWTSNSGTVKGSFGLFATNTGRWGESWTDLVTAQAACNSSGQNGLICFEN